MHKVSQLDEMEMDVHGDQGCSRATFDNFECIWDNRVVVKSHIEIPKQNNGRSAALLEAGSLHLLLRMCGQEGWVGGGSAARKSSGRRAGASTAGDMEQELCHVVSPKPVFRTPS